MNRTLPKIYPAPAMTIPQVDTLTLVNGLKVYIVRSKLARGCKIEWCHKAGRSSEVKQMAASLTASMLAEGSNGKTAEQINKYFEGYGSGIFSYHGFDFNIAGFICTIKHFDRLLRSFLDITTSPIFPEQKLQLNKNLKINDLNLDMSRGDFKSYAILTEQLFGPKHPYGYNASPEKIRNVNTNDVKTHFQSKYFTIDSFVILSGQIDDILLQKSLDVLSKINLKSSKEEVLERENLPWTIQSYNDDLQEKNQVSIKLGRIVPHSSDPDFTSLYFLHFILGGTFNARLNQKIREKKGLTYHIGSSYDLYFNGAVFYISCDTSIDQQTQVLKLIDQELDVLCTKPIPKAEILRTIEYLTHQAFVQFDGAFAISETLRQAVIEGYSIQKYIDWLDRLKSLHPHDLLEIAKKYFTHDLFKVVII